jgi:hypothetical protein
MTEGGIMEVIAYWPQGEGSNIGVGAFGAIASAILLVSGVAFLTRRAFGRRAAFLGATGMAAVHFLGWTLGMLGVPGVLAGVVYPALLLLALRANPGLGAPSEGKGHSAPVKPERHSDDTTKRAALHAAWPSRLDRLGHVTLLTSGVRTKC